MIFDSINPRNHEPSGQPEIADLSPAVTANLSRKIRSLFGVARSVITKVDGVVEGKKLILIADDEPLGFQLIEEFLSDANISCDIITATNGQKAFALAEQLVPDLIIADWLMPDLNGLELVRKIKECPLTKSIPVILATGVLADQNQLDEFFAAGVADFIRKPIDYSELKGRVTSALMLDNSQKETKLMHESYNIQDELLGLLGNIAPNAIFYMDNSGRLLGCNSSFELLFGANKTNVAFRSFHEFLPDSIADIIEIHLSSLTSGKPSAEFEAQMPFNEKQQKQLKITLTRLGSASHPLIVGSVTDVTKAVMVVAKEKVLVES